MSVDCCYNFHSFCYADAIDQDWANESARSSRGPDPYTPGTREDAIDAYWSDKLSAATSSSDQDTVLAAWTKDRDSVAASSSERIDSLTPASSLDSFSTRHSSLRKRDRADASSSKQKLVSWAEVAPELFYAHRDTENRKRERELDDVRKDLASLPIDAMPMGTILWIKICASSS